MQIYEVGGAVRDELLGVHAQDHDKVIVGATAADVADMKARGFLPMGKDFPVLQCPDTGDEYALARTERKIGAGYHGFEFKIENVTLEEDLSRRDLTINAMAKDANGTVIDPFGGRADLQSHVLRHVSEAFAEDPLRVLRVARFIARFGPSWSVAPETLALMYKMVASGELEALAPERIWKEVSRGLMEEWPLLMVRLMQQLRIFERPVMADYAGVLYGFTSAMQQAAANAEPLAVRFALAFPRAWTREQALASRVPAQVREVTELAQTLRGANVANFVNMSAEARMQLVERLDAVRQVERCDLVLRTLSYTDDVAPLRAAVERFRAVDLKAITQGMKPGPAVGEAIRAARMDAVAA